MKVKSGYPGCRPGNRLPATKAQPKEMLPIVDKPTIQHVVEEAAAAGIEDILIITGRNKRAIEDHFRLLRRAGDDPGEKGKNGFKDHSRDLELAIFLCAAKGAARPGPRHGCAAKFVGNEPFAVMLGDDIIYSAVPCIKQLMAVYEERGGTVLGVQPVAKSALSKYGIVDAGGESGPVVRVRSLVEKPAVEKAPGNLAVLGRYIISPEVFAILDESHREQGVKFSLPTP